MANAISALGMAQSMWNLATAGWGFCPPPPGLPPWQALNGLLSLDDYERLRRRLIDSGLIRNPYVVQQVLAMLASGAGLKDVPGFLDRLAGQRPEPAARPAPGASPPQQAAPPLPSGGPAAASTGGNPAPSVPSGGALPQGHLELAGLKQQVQAALSRKEGELRAAQSQLEAARRAVTEKLAQELSEADRAKFRQARDRHEKAQRKQNELKGQQREATTRRTRLEGQQKVEQERLSAATRDVHSAQGRVSQLRGSLGDPPDPGVQGQLSAAEADLDAARARQQQARDALTRIHNELVKVNAELTRIDQELAAAGREARAALQEMDRIRKVQAGDTQRRMELDPAVRAAQSRVESLEREVQALHGRLQEVETALAAAESKLVREGNDPGRLPPELNERAQGGPASTLGEGVTAGDKYSCLDSATVYAEANAGQKVLLLQDTDATDEEMERATGQATHHAVVVDSRGRVVFDGSQRVIPPRPLEDYLSQTGYRQFRDRDGNLVGAVDPSMVRDPAQAADLAARLQVPDGTPLRFSDGPREVNTGPLAYDAQLAARAQTLIDTHRPGTDGYYTRWNAAGQLVWADTGRAVTVDELQTMQDASRMAVARPSGGAGTEFDADFEDVMVYSDIDADDPARRILETMLTRERLGRNGIQAFSAFNRDLDSWRVEPDGHYRGITTRAVEMYLYTCEPAAREMKDELEDFQEASMGFARFTAEYGPYLSSTELNSAQAVFSRNAGYRTAFGDLSAEAEQFAAVLRDPLFQGLVFQNMDTQEKLDLFQTIADIGQTPAGAALNREIFNGLVSQPPGIYARALEELVAREADVLRRLGSQRPQTDAVFRATMIASQVVAIAASEMNPGRMLPFLESRMARILFGETAELKDLFGRLISAGELGPDDYYAARRVLVGRIQDRINSGGVAYVAGGFLSGLLMVQDLWLITHHPDWGANLAADAKLFVDLASDGGTAAAMGFKAFASAFKSQAPRLVAWATALEGRLLPVLGAISAFAGAFVNAGDGNTVAAIGDVVGGVGFLVAMIPVPGAQALGLLVSAVGTLISIGNHLWREHQREQEYQALVRQMLEAAVPPGDPRRAILPGLDRERLKRLAEANHLTVQEAWNQVYQRYLQLVSDPSYAHSAAEFNALLASVTWIPDFGFCFYGDRVQQWASRSGVSAAEAWRSLQGHAQGFRSRMPNHSAPAALALLGVTAQDRLWSLAQRSGRSLEDTCYLLFQLYASLGPTQRDRTSDFMEFLSLVQWSSSGFYLNGPLPGRPEHQRPPVAPGSG
ncbi:MAG: hypothetical protein AB1758_01065 [Candidatus Eremiobacterota bacterium]